MSSSRTLAVLTACLAACAFLFWQAHDEPPVVLQVRVATAAPVNPPSVAVAPHANVGQSAKAASSLTAPTPVAPAALPAITSDLGRKLLEVTNLRAFVLDALKQPERGGAFYAILALRRCKQLEFDRSTGERAIQNIVNAESTISPERLAAITAPTMLCRDFSYGEVDALREKAEQLGLSGADPMLKLAMSQRDTVPKEERSAALKMIAESRNMALISEVGAPFFMLRETSTFFDGNNVLTTRFDGQTYGRYDAAKLQIAADLATCVQGEYCKVDEYRLGHCWLTGECIADREEFMRVWAFGGRSEAFEKVLAFSSQMRAALVRGDTSIFR